MKKIIITLLFLSGVAHAQQTPPYTAISSSPYYWKLPGAFDYLSLPRGCDTATAWHPVQTRRAGAIFVDTCLAKAFIWYGYWKEVGSSSINSNAGSGYRWLNASDQSIKTAFSGYGVILDSTSNTNGLTTIIDTATVFPAVRATIPISSGGGLTGGNAGSGYRAYIPSSMALRTMFAGYGIAIDSSSNTNGLTYTADTLQMSTRAYRQKGIDSVAGLSANKRDNENVFGVIYKDSLWSAGDFTNDFSVNGATATDSAGVIVLSGGTSTLTKTVDININQTYNITPYYSNLEDWTFEIKGQVITHGVLPIGMRSYAANNTSAIIYGYINTTTGAQLLHCGNTINGSTPITVNLGDHFLLKVERHGWKMSMTFRNLTTNSATVTTSGAIGHLSTAPPVTGKYSIFAYTGKFYIDSIGISSNTTKDASVLVIGDSKSQLFPQSGTSQKRWPNLLAENYRIVNHAGRAEYTADWLLTVPEVLALRPKQVIIGACSNDLRFAVNTDSTKARYYRLERSLRDAGIAVYHLDGIYESAKNNQAWADYINSTRSADSVIKTLAATNVAGALEADNVHPNDLGNTIVYYQIMGKGVLKGATNNYESSGRFIQNLYTTEPSQYASINIIGNYKQVGNIDQTGGAKFGTGAAATSLTDVFKVHTNTSNYTYIYSNGTVGNALIWGNASGAAAANLQAGSYYGSSHLFRTVTSSAYNNALYIGANGLIGIGTTSPSAQLHVNASTTNTNSVAEVTRISLASTGAAAAGLGIRELKEMRNGSGVFKSLAYLDWIQTDATNLSEDADMSVSLFRNGTSTEALRVLSTGDLAIKRIQATTEQDSVLVQADGLVKAINIPISAAGTYTPTLTNGSNVTSSSVIGTFRYTRIGNIVEVTGIISIAQTAGLVSTDIGVSLPISSNFSTGVQCSGVMTNQGAESAGKVTGDATNDRAVIEWYPSGITSYQHVIKFSYEIL